MLLIKNGRVIDPANNIDAVLDIFINQGKIIRIGKNIDPERVRRDIGKLKEIESYYSCEIKEMPANLEFIQKNTI